MIRLLPWILRMLAWLPLRWNHRLGAGLGTLYRWLSSRARHVCRVNVKKCFPRLKGKQQKQFITSSFGELGKTVTELGPVWFWPQPRLFAAIKQIEGEHVLEQAMTAGNGAIIAAPHLGCWELVGLYCSSRYPMTNLYRPPKFSQLDGFVRRRRQRFGARLVPTDAGGVKQLFAALNKGELIGILPDQDPGKRGSGHFVPFFGHPAKTMALLFKLANKTRAKVIFTFAERLPKGDGFTLHFIPAEPVLYDGPLTEALTSMNRSVEQCIATAPDQYQWTYKRFRCRPDGEPPFY